MPNSLIMGSPRAIPDTVPNNGGTVSIQFAARTAPANVTASVTYAVTAGQPFRVTAGGSANPALTTTNRTVAQNVRIARTNATAVSFVQIDVIASVPGDVTQTHPCFVSIGASVGEHLRTFRVENELTQNDLAQRLGVSRSTISRVESGCLPSTKIFQTIAEEIS